MIILQVEEREMGPKDQSMDLILWEFKNTPFVQKNDLHTLSQVPQKQNFPSQSKDCSLASELLVELLMMSFLCLAYYKLNRSQEPLHMVYPKVEKGLCFCCSICFEF
jgi:hypothetical protein